MAIINHLITGGDVLRSKLTIIIGAVLVILLGLSLFLHTNSRKLTKEKQRLQKEISHLDKNITSSKKDLEQLTKDYKEAILDQYVKDTGADPRVKQIDEEQIEGFLAQIFDWSTGEEYDKQRQAIIDSKIPGSDKIVKEHMAENYRVPVPEDLKGKIKDNYIDVEGLKSKTTAMSIDVANWSTSETTYFVQASYQLYLNDDDLDGRNKTIKTLVFLMTIDGDSSNRQIKKIIVEQPI